MPSTGILQVVFPQAAYSFDDAWLQLKRLYSLLNLCDITRVVTETPALPLNPPPRSANFNRRGLPTAAWAESHWMLEGH